MARPRAPRFVAVLVAAGLLAACAGPGPGPVAEPPASVAPPEQPPVAEPTQGTGAEESPLPEAQPKPVLTTAAAGTGNGQLVAPDTVCLFWTWGGGLPELTDGVTFSVDHPQVVPATWTASRDACGDNGGGVQWCDGAQITVDSSTCVIGFARSGTPAAQALVGMVGTLQCTLSADDCATFTQAVDDSPDVSPDLDLEAVAGGGG